MDGDIRIVCVRDCPERLREAAAWFHEKWGVPQDAYEASLRESLTARNGVPEWVLALAPDGRIAGGLGVIENDFHLRPELRPNVCAVFVEEAFRGRGLAGALLARACADLAENGVPDVYLLTDHIGFYERYGWRFIGPIEEIGGGTARGYHRPTRETGESGAQTATADIGDR